MPPARHVRTDVRARQGREVTTHPTVELLRSQPLVQHGLDVPRAAAGHRLGAQQLHQGVPRGSDPGDRHQDANESKSLVPQRCRADHEACDADAQLDRPGDRSHAGGR